MLEEPFFFNNSRYNLFGILHRPSPEKEKKDCGVVFCAPFAEEKLWSQRVYVSFARELAGEGYAVFRFDYMGHGDSEGNFEDSTIETRLSDIAKSVEVLRSKTGVSRVGLLGLRLGGTLAAISSEKLRDINFLILWEPVVKVESYLQQCLRSNIATQMATYKKVIRNRKELTKDLLIGKPVDIDGYMMSGEFYNQAVLINFGGNSMNYSNPVLIVNITKNEKLPVKKDLESLYESIIKGKNRNSELSQLVEEPFWSEIKTYYQKAPNLFNKTISWLDGVINTESD